MIRRFQIDSDSRPVFFEIEVLHEANWYQPLSEPQQPPRIHVSVIPYDMFRPVYFAPEDIHIGNWFQELAVPQIPPRIEVRNIPFELSTNPYFGIEITSMDKWFHPLDHPGQPKHLPISALPYTWFVQFESPVFPVPSVATWFQELERPRPRRLLPVSDYPTVSYVRLPNVYGCIEAEITEFYILRAWPEPQMPVLKITRWYPLTTSPSCDNTQQSPGSQPQYSGG